MPLCCMPFRQDTVRRRDRVVALTHRSAGGPGSTGQRRSRHSTVAAALVNREIVRHGQQPRLRVIQRPLLAQVTAKSKESLLGQIFGCSRIPGLPQEVAEDRLLQLLKQRQDTLAERRLLGLRRIDAEWERTARESAVIFHALTLHND